MGGDSPSLSSADVERIEKGLVQLSKRFAAWYVGIEDDPDRREVVTSVATLLFEFRAWYRDGDPWDEEMLHQALMGHLPRKADLDEADVHATPGATHFVLQFLGEVGEISDGMLGRMTAELAELAPEFVRAMADPDNFGMAKRLARQMDLEGIDPSQAEELQAWMADFNERPIEERAELIPDSVFGRPSDPGVGQAWAGDAPRPKRRQDHAARKRNRRRGG